MKKQDVEYLFDRIPIGTKVSVVKSKKSFQQLAKEKGAIAYEKVNNISWLFLSLLVPIQKGG